MRTDVTIIIEGEFSSSIGCSSINFSPSSPHNVTLQVTELHTNDRWQNVKLNDMFYYNFGKKEMYM